MLVFSVMSLSCCGPLFSGQWRAAIHPQMDIDLPIVSAMNEAGFVYPLTLGPNIGINSCDPTLESTWGLCNMVGHMVW